MQEYAQGGRCHKCTTRSLRICILVRKPFLVDVLPFPFGFWYVFIFLYLHESTWLQMCFRNRRLLAGGMGEGGGWGFPNIYLSLTGTYHLTGMHEQSFKRGIQLVLAHKTGSWFTGAGGHHLFYPTQALNNTPSYCKKFSKIKCS